MKVRFKIGQAADANHRVAYELEDDNQHWEYDDVYKNYCMCYNLKLLGFVCAHLLEITTDENDIPAIDVFINLSLL